MLLVTSMIQLTINPKDGKMPSLGSSPASIRAAYQVARLVECKSLKVMMDVGRDLREGKFLA